MSPDDVRQEIELKVVELIQQMVTKGSITEERSQVLAKLVLDILRPAMNWEELLHAIPKLDDTAPELSPVIIPYLREYESKVTQAAESTVRSLIRQGQYDAATTLAQKAISQNIDLVWTGKASAP